MLNLKGKLVRVFSACCALVLTTACGALPETYPTVKEYILSAESEPDKQRFDINFYFQNNENTHCIKGGTANDFFKNLFGDEDGKAGIISNMRNSESEDYVLSYDPTTKQYGLEKYDPAEYDNNSLISTIENYRIDGAKGGDKENFYILGDNFGDIDSGARSNGGILKLIVNEMKKSVPPANAPAEEGEAPEADEAAEETVDSMFDPDAVSVIFTDLSEGAIGERAKEIYQLYSSRPEYSACILSAKLITEENQLVWITASNSSEPSFAPTEKRGRMYYLLILGPSADMGIFVDNFKQTLNDKGWVQNGKLETENRSYYISDLYFKVEDFNFDNDIKCNSLISGEADLSGMDDQQIFENSIVRLEEVPVKESAFAADSLLRDQVHEYRYVKDTGNYKIKGYRSEGLSYDDSSTKDFALTMELDKIVDKGNVISDNTDVNYTFGNVENIGIYVEKDGEWVPMDKIHKERFFKRINITDKCFKQENDEWIEITQEEYDELIKVKNDIAITDSRRKPVLKKTSVLNIISDNADECDQHNVYITVPICQRAILPNYIISEPGSTNAWVNGYCNNSDKTANTVKTNFFNEFYEGLFDLVVAGSRDDKNIRVDEYTAIDTQIDVMKILIEDVH